MSLADLWHVEQYENISIISPDENNILNYKLGVYQTILILKSQGVEIPPHTVMIFPTDYYRDESPVSYIKQNLILLFPIRDETFSISEYVMFQYFHELGHLIVGEFEEPQKWIGELLACSLNHFFYPKDTNKFSFYYVNIALKTLTFEHNQLHYHLIEKVLSANQYLVYKGDHQIRSALFAYSLENKEFNFVSLLQEFYASQNNPEERKKCIEKIEYIFNCSANTVQNK